MYRLVYISTRYFDGSLIPVDIFEPVPMDAVYDDYNEADRMRCELCSVMNYGYVRIEEDAHTSNDYVRIEEDAHTSNDYVRIEEDAHTSNDYVRIEEDAHTSNDYVKIVEE